MANASPEQMRAGIASWSAWAKKNEGLIVDLGAPLGGGRRTGARDTAADETITGYSIVHASSMDAVAKAFQDHPHRHVPGESSIDILEVMSMPGA